MITTLRAVEPGTDGAVSFAGTLAGMAAAGIVAAIGTLALRGDLDHVLAISCAGAVFGLFFDSLLGATLERRGWLNNDAVNFLSTASAAGFAGLAGFIAGDPPVHSLPPFAHARTRHRRLRPMSLRHLLSADASARAYKLRISWAMRSVSPRSTSRPVRADAER